MKDRNDVAGRLFLAVPLTESVRAALSSEARRAGPLPGRPVLPESWHLTLRFLGDTPADSLDRLRDELKVAPLDPPFSIRFGAYGAFPRANRAAVLWLGVDEGLEPLQTLAAEVEMAVRRAGFPAEGRPFKAHLTLSRLRPPEDVRPVLERLPAFGKSMPVEEVVLFRSHLGRGPARYEPLERFTLR